MSHNRSVRASGALSSAGGPGRGELLLALGSLTALLALLLGAEFGARRLHPADPAASDLAALHDYSDVYGWAPRPGARFVADGNSTSINAKGYRGRVVAARPPAGVKRVVLLGDSLTFGIDVAEDQTFAHLLDVEDALEVVNLAVQGYGLDQDLLKLEREGLAFAPQVVVLNVCLDNDLADIGLAHFLYDGQHPKPYFRLEGGELVLHAEQLRISSRARLAGWLRQRSRLYDWLVAPGAGDADEHWTIRKSRALHDAGQVQELALRLIERMRDQTRARGAAFMVVLHPDKASFRNGSPWIDSFLASPGLAGTRVIDLRRAYLERGARWQDLTLDTIGHLTPAGHRLAAEILGPALSSAEPPPHRSDQLG